MTKPILTRVVVRVVAHNPNLKAVRVVIPQWSPDQEILISSDLFKPYQRNLLTQNARFTAEVNLGAQVVGDLSLKEFAEVPNTPEYLALLRTKQNLMMLLPYLRSDTNPVAFAQGIYHTTMETLELICQTIGEPLPEGFGE